MIKWTNFDEKKLKMHKFDVKIIAKTGKYLGKLTRKM
jgi:hypothetical protein